MCSFDRDAFGKRPPHPWCCIFLAHTPWCHTSALIAPVTPVNCPSFPFGKLPGILEEQHDARLYRLEQVQCVIFSWQYSIINYHENAKRQSPQGVPAGRRQSFLGPSCNFLNQLSLLASLSSMSWRKHQALYDNRPKHFIKAIIRFNTHSEQGRPSKKRKVSMYPVYSPKVTQPFPQGPSLYRSYSEMLFQTPKRIESDSIGSRQRCTPLLLSQNSY